MVSPRLAHQACSYRPHTVTSFSVMATAALLPISKVTSQSNTTYSFFFFKCQLKFSLRIHRGYSHPLAYTYHCFLPLPGQRNTTSSPETHFWNLLPETNSCTNLHVCSVSFEGGGKEGKDKCELSRRSLAFLLNVCPFDISLLTRFACCIKDFSSRKQFLIWPYSNVLD